MIRRTPIDVVRPIISWEVEEVVSCARGVRGLLCVGCQKVCGDYERRWMRWMTGYEKSSKRMREGGTSKE